MNCRYSIHFCVHPEPPFFLCNLVTVVPSPLLSFITTLIESHPRLLFVDRPENFSWLGLYQAVHFWAFCQKSCEITMWPGFPCIWLVVVLLISKCLDWECCIGFCLLYRLLLNCRYSGIPFNFCNLVTGVPSSHVSLVHHPTDRQNSDVCRWTGIFFLNGTVCVLEVYNLMVNMRIWQISYRFLQIWQMLVGLSTSI